MAFPMVSVVMSVLNAEKFLSETLDSILDQSFRDFEVILIDDGSTDDTPTILERWRLKDSRITVLSQQNRGLVESLNRGCSQARGKYIARMDADDVALPDRFRLQVDFMEAHSEVGVLGGNVELMNANGRLLGIKSDFALSNEEIQAALIQRCTFCHPTVFIRRSTFLAVRGYRMVRDAEDYDLWLRIAEQAEMANLPDVLIRYRFHKSQVTTSSRGRWVLGGMAAQAAAKARREGKPDPLDDGMEISWQSVRDMGVSEQTLETAIARGYLVLIRHAYCCGEDALALELFQTMLSSNCNQVDKWIVADAYLEMSKVNLRRKNLRMSFSNLGQAILIRPTIMGRPAKQFFHKARTLFQPSVITPSMGTST
jgi:glycosyltransferase involved in cell wall biosynthesis